MSEGWAMVRRAVEAVIAERPGEYGAEVRAVMADLLAMMEARGCARPEVGPGYWPTFNLTWDEPGAENLRLEVFGHVIEVYRYNDTLFDVWDEDHTPGEGFSEAFIRELPVMGS